MSLRAILLDGAVVIISRRDDPSGRHIELLPSQWEAFLAAAKAGELDQLPRKGEDLGWREGSEADALRRGI